MKSMRFIALVLALATASTIVADETTCPASRAAGQGFAPFEAFHSVMAPAWHQAWPDEDYDALLAVGPEFSKLFKPIALLKPPLKTRSRRLAFLKNRQEFAALVRDYGKAATACDSAAVYEIMPRLHDAFEATASCLLPIHYPEFDGFVITVNLIAETHLPRTNRPGIVGSTETMGNKVKQLTSESIPKELGNEKAEILKQFDLIRDLVEQLNSHRHDDDLTTYVEIFGRLEGVTSQFVEKYI